ncbi:MAG: hypothetical protein KatS3mg111_2737 [Pirellulaceae bacterium]|nr:MAG: hypothetical protein KatS3mg111_2737 [Pirellulaceae bacterium]
MTKRTNGGLIRLYPVYLRKHGVSENPVTLSRKVQRVPLFLSSTDATAGLNAH